ncbi:calcium-responsive transcription factor-like [Montipora capricornis]|uniref:calcium-responsive transcription factor-like n=1 Tax=Montipora capricornis TaxID=246305 RepID=UPI0035F1032A
MSKKLKTDIISGKKPQVERRIYVHLPKEDDHKDHIIGEVGGILQPINKRLDVKIEELVGEGVKTFDEMKRHLRQFVKMELFPGQAPPASTNRCYYPIDVDVTNHMYKASVKKMLSKTDQEHMQKKHSPKQKRECHFTWAARSHWLLFSAFVDYQMIYKNMFSATMANAKNGIIQNVLKYQTG